jgi:hypothetical protein
VNRVVFLKQRLGVRHGEQYETQLSEIMRHQDIFWNGCRTPFTPAKASHEKINDSGVETIQVEQGMQYACPFICLSFDDDRGRH